MRHRLSLHALNNTSNTSIVPFDLTEIKALTNAKQCCGHLPSSCQDCVRQELIAFWHKITREAQVEGELLLEVKLLLKRFRSGEILPQKSYLRELSGNHKRASQFSSLICALRLVIINFNVGRPTTMRDIYYRDVDTFQGRQSNSNASLELLSVSLEYLLASDLLIHPCAKGLMWSEIDLKLLLNGEIIMHANSEKGPQLITHVQNCAIIESLETPKFIAIFEKEAVFKSFHHSAKLLKDNVGSIMLTGKGFADRETKAMLQSLHKAYPQVPIYVFVDSDVYGLRIFWDYQKLLNEQAEIHLAGTFLMEHETGLLTIANHEWKCLLSFLRSNGGVHDPVLRHTFILHRELTRGLLLGKKAEMNVVSSDADYADTTLNRYIWGKLKRVVHVTSRD